MRTHAICAALSALAAASVIEAQTPPKVDPRAVVRKVLLQQDLVSPANYSLALVSVEIPVGGREGRHTHSGSLAVYVLEGAISMDYEGKPSVIYKAGETAFIEAGTIHEGINRGTVPARGIASFVVPKGQPLTTQVP